MTNDPVLSLIVQIPHDYIRIFKHKHCVFCGEVVSDQPLTSECKSEYNTLRPDTSGRRYHLVLSLLLRPGESICGSSHDPKRGGDAVLELIEKYRPKPDALFEYDGDNHGDTAQAASNITAREIIRQLESILPQRDIEASNSAKREVWAYVQKFLGKEGSDGSTFEDWVRERDAATRIAALEEAAEKCDQFAAMSREGLKNAEGEGAMCLRIALQVATQMKEIILALCTPRWR